MNSKLIFLALAFLTSILAVRIGYYLLNYTPYPQAKIITFETTLPDSPKMTGRGQQITLSLPNSQRAVIVFPLLPTLSYGDLVKVQGKIDYFKATDGKMIAFISYPKFALVKKGDQSSLIVKVRENIISFFDSSLGVEDSSLMLGIVFGIKEQMPTNFYANLQKSGLLHVIAASGMNITMVGGFLVSTFTIFLKRQYALSLTIVGILFYAVLAGLEPSIVRAAIMGVLVLFAQLLGRQNSAFLGLFAAAFVMLFLNPSLIYDIGFQLSFMATFGLVYLRPIFDQSKKLRKLIEKSLIGEDIATTITAQAVTLPILLVNFGSYSLVSVLVNALVLWTVPILMIIGGFAATIGLIFAPLGRVIGYFSLPFLIYFEKVVDFFGSKASLISISSVPVTMIAGYYLILLSIIVYLRRK